MKRINVDLHGLLSLIGVGIGSLALGYFFVWNNGDLIEDVEGFWLLVAVLILLSFMLSAVEAAFSVAGNNKDVTNEIGDLMVRRTTKVAEADAKVVAAAIDASRTLRRKQRAAFRALERLKRKEGNLIGSGRIRVVGALSALNVIINTALVTFLPTFLATFDRTGDDSAPLLPPDKLLILVASALPILYFGKIVPKMVGLQHSYGWGYSLYWIGNTADWLIGWVPRGLAYGLTKVRLMRPNS